MRGSIHAGHPLHSKPLLDPLHSLFSLFSRQPLDPHFMDQESRARDREVVCLSGLFKVIQLVSRRASNVAQVCVML